MNGLRKILVSIVLLCGASTLHAQTVRILAVSEPGVTAGISDMRSQMLEIQDVFSRSVGNTVNIEIVNGGTPEPLTNPITGSTSIIHTINARNDSQLIQKRNASNADLVVAFVTSLPEGSGVCGFGYQPLWQSGQGMSPPLGPDLRGKELWYVALVVRSSTCNQNNNWLVFAAHEIGHLFGAGHHNPFFNGLLSNSYADFLNPIYRPDNIGTTCWTGTFLQEPGF